MLTYINGSTAAVVVVHEIYGLNDHIKDFCKKLSEQGADVFAPDLLNRGIPFGYGEEDMAYRNFTGCIGFDSAADRVKELLTQIRGRHKRVYLTGFSVGATVAWLCSVEKLCDAVFGFYGSRIRDYIEVVPQCPVLLFFPDREKSFDVDELIGVLTKKDNVRVRKFNAGHGFADPFSKNYCRKSFEKAYKEMTAMITENCFDLNIT